MLEVKDQALLDMGALKIHVALEKDQPSHRDVLIELELGFVLYNTATQCIFLAYKSMYDNDETPDVVTDLCKGKEMAMDPANNYRGFTFVIQPSVFTRMRNDLFTSLVSCAIRHYDQEVGLPAELKKHASEFPFVDLLEEQVLVLNEPVNHDVVFAAPRFAHQEG